LSESFASDTVVDSGRRVVNLRGDLDLASAAQASEALRGGFDVLDVSGLEFLDSSGLRVLVQSSQGLESPPVLRGASGQVKRILELSGISTVFVIEEAGGQDGNPPASPI
jgi:anti-anti-sigma factor